MCKMSDFTHFFFKFDTLLYFFNKKKKLLMNVIPTNKCQQIKTLRLKLALLNCNKNELSLQVFKEKRNLLRNELYAAVSNNLRRRCS